jgi:hypothetical protein
MEKTQVSLVVDAVDVIVKNYVAGVWKGPEHYTGFNYSTSFYLSDVSKANCSRKKICLRNANVT